MSSLIIQQGRVRNYINGQPPQPSWSQWIDCKGSNTGKIVTCGCVEHRLIRRTITEEVMSDGINP